MKNSHKEVFWKPTAPHCHTSYEHGQNEEHEAALAEQRNIFESHQHHIAELHSEHGQSGDHEAVIRRTTRGRTSRTTRSARSTPPRTTSAKTTETAMPNYKSTDWPENIPMKSVNTTRSTKGHHDTSHCKKSTASMTTAKCRQSPPLITGLHEEHDEKR